MATVSMTISNQVTHRRKRRGVWIVLFCVVTATTATGWWSQHRKAATNAGSNRFQWITPEMRNITTNVNATGTVKLKTGAQVRVGAQLSGIVRRLNVTVGSHVRQGDVIAAIDSRSIMARVDQARTQLAQAEVSRAKAQTDFSRTQRLFEAGLIPAQQFDDAGSALEAAKAAVTAAQSGLSAAQVDMEYVEIRAPISGTVASIATQQGETVAASFATPTFVTIIQEGALEVVALVDEADIGNVHRGERADFTAETYPDRKFQGVVTRIAPIATVISGVVNYEVAVSIERDIAFLRPDMTTNVNIRTAELRALLIPSKCIRKDGMQSFVYVQLPTGGAERRNVAVATRVADHAEISRGLSPDDRIQLETGAATP